jgi:hypothetical protein
MECATPYGRLVDFVICLTYHLKNKVLIASYFMLPLSFAVGSLALAQGFQVRLKIHVYR